MRDTGYPNTMSCERMREATSEGGFRQALRR